MLPQKYRLSRQKDFEDIFKQKKSSSSQFLSLFWRFNNLGFPRLAVVVSTKISKKAVARNRLRRQLQEIIRLNFKKIKPGFDTVVVVKTGLIKREYLFIEKEFINLLKKIGLYFVND